MVKQVLIKGIVCLYPLRQTWPGRYGIVIFILGLFNATLVTSVVDDPFVGVVLLVVATSVLKELRPDFQILYMQAVLCTSVNKQVEPLKM